MCARLSPDAALAGDTAECSLLQNGGNGSDTSGFFVERFLGDPDGVYPWTGSVDMIDVGAFRLTLADVPPLATTLPAATKKKCKKSKKAAAAKKKRCKKKR